VKIIERRRIYFAVSLTIIAFGVIWTIIQTALGNGPFNFDVEFKGGTSLYLDIGQAFENGDIAAVIKEKTGQTSPQIQKVGGGSEVMIKMQSIGQEARLSLVEALAEKYARTADELVITSGDVSPTISNEMQSAAVLAVAVACLAMLVYVSLRFRNVFTGGAAVITLIHDAAIMLCAYSILRIPLNYSFIAAILTVLGYSINATIVIFDRQRENARADKRLSREELVNTSVRQTLTRSVYTSVTTLFTLLALYIVGVQSVKEFALPIIVGIVSGTYSSVLLAGSVWYTLTGAKKAAR
jgi:preprotein translocase SecF subunit